MKHYLITVSGKVQGVFYRQSAFEIAEQLGIKGFVRNEPDGTVYIEAEGPEKQLKKFIEWCKKGSPHAEVSDVNISESKLKNFSSFEIRR